MSRIGRRPVDIPDGVEVSVDDANLVTVRGPRGELSQSMHPTMRIVTDPGQARVERPDDVGFSRSLHGLTRSLLANMVEGVTQGFEKRLQIVGVGYRAALKGKDIELQVGYSHPVVVPQPDGIEFEVPAPTQVVVRGNDKQLVGEVAAKIRKIRKPEPYKGKGIRYENEYVRKKAGKAAKGDRLMDAKTRREARVRRHARVRKKVTGTAERPRLAVFRSNRHIYVQLIDDAAATLAAASTPRSAAATSDAGGKLASAKEVGKLIADRAKGAGIDRVVFDRGGRRFHGRVAAIAEGAREGGLRI